MTRRTLTTRLNAIGDRADSPIDPQFRAFARAVIVFGGHEPRPDAVEGFSRWLVHGRRSNPGSLQIHTVLAPAIVSA
jgi:hypothetical protein